MMKILCLLVILANLYVLLWEYRQGAFSAPPKQTAQLTVTGTEPIILLNEKNPVVGNQNATGNKQH